MHFKADQFTVGFKDFNFLKEVSSYSVTQWRIFLELATAEFVLLTSLTGMMRITETLAQVPATGPAHSKIHDLC